MEYLLYDKKILLTYSETGHRYSVQSLLPDGSWGEPRDVWGVTSILKFINKPALVPWAAGMASDYFLEQTLNKKPTEKELKKIARESRQAHTRKKDDSADIGTQIHNTIQAFLEDKEVDLANSDERVGEAVQAFTGWWLGRDYKATLVEQPVYSLNGGYAGRFDLTFKDGDTSVLGDIKTSNTSKWAPDGVYIEAFAQLGGYAKALFEMYQKTPDELVIINAGKDGKLRTVWGRDFGMTVNDAIRYWDRIHAAWLSHRKWETALKGM